MKKLIAIILSAVLLFTSIVSASMFTVSAEGEATEPLTDTAVMPVLVDEKGNEILLPHTSESIPTSVMSGKGAALVKNNTKLPFSTLFQYDVDGGTKSTTLSIKGDEKGKGAIVYVEMPESANKQNVIFSVQFSVYDGQSGSYGGRHQYGQFAWYYRANGDTAWEQSKTNKFYGSYLPSGFKGYVYIPFGYIQTGASDIPETPENEARPQKRNSKGDLIYSYTIPDPDDETKTKVVETTEATDGEGNPYTPVYTYSPDAGTPGYLNCGIDDEDCLKSLIFQVGNNYSINNCNLPADGKVTVSAPIIVKGSTTDLTPPADDSIVVGGKKYDYNLGLEGATEHTFPSISGITTINNLTFADNSYDSDTDYVKSIKGASFTTTKSAVRITDAPTYAVEQYVHAYDTTNVNPTLAFDFADNRAVLQSNEGLFFYVNMSAYKDGETAKGEVLNVNMRAIKNGSVVESCMDYNWSKTAKSYYYLAEGDDAWTPRYLMSNDEAINIYGTKTPGSYGCWVPDGFVGYIYIPYNMFREYNGPTQTSAWVGLYLGAYNPTSRDYGKIYIGSPMITSVFNADSTLAYGPDGRLVDLSTGEYHSKANIEKPAEFNGNINLLPNLDGDNYFAFDTLALSDVVLASEKGVALDSGIFTSRLNTFNYNVVERDLGSNKLPIIQATALANDTAGGRITIMKTGGLKTKGYKGLLFYVENNSANEATLDWQYSLTYFDGTQMKTAAYHGHQHSGTFKFMAVGSTTWTTKTMSNYALPIAPGEKGYLYVDIAQLRNMTTEYAEADTTVINDFKILWNQYGSANKLAEGESAVISLPAMVSNWTEENSGLVRINGSTVPQNVWNGDFGIANDFDDNLAVDILDLVRAKSEASETQFATFRANYLNKYFNDAEYSVLSAAFSVAPLTYLASDATTILSSNPDRGYRSEMVLYFASEPLKISDTPDYTPQLLSGTGYTVDVSANAIFDSDIASGKREPQTETDYNISNTPSNDGYPMGDGSGGAVHTVTVEVLRAWITAHNNYVQERVNAKDGAYRASYKLIQASGETLDNFYSRAAVHLVSNYMTYEIKRSDMFVNELVKVVYLNDDQKAQVKYTGDWYDHNFTIDGVERYIRVEGNASAKNFFYYDNAGCRVYNDDGSLKELKIHVYHDPRTIFASDSTAEWDSRLRTYFVQYKIGYNDVDAKTYYTRKVTLADGTSETIEIANNLFNAYLTFTEFAHSDELPAGVLDALDYFFKYCAKVGAKANFRPSYNTFTQNAYLSQNIIGYQQFKNNVESECADEATMIAHIKQMAPIVAANKDAIHNISSGWIGFGGEMAAGYQYPPVSYKNVITAVIKNFCIPNDLYFSSRSSNYYMNIVNGVEAVEGYNSGNLDLKYGLTADAEWAEKYAKWCGFNNDAFFGDQNFADWGSSNYYDVDNPNFDNDNAIAHIAPNDGEMYTNGSHVYNITVDANGVYHWIGDGTTATDNKIPTPMEAIRELAYHRYTDFSQWHAYLDNINTKGTTTVMELWQDHDAQWVFEGEVDSIANGGYFNAEERAAEITKPVTKADLEANGILYDPAYFASTDTVNAYEFIRDHLGYRLVAQDVKVDYNESKSDKVNVTVNLKNYGFGAAFNMESTLAIFDTEGNLVQQIKAGDPSTWYNLAPDYYTVERTSSAQGDALIHSVSAGFDSLKDGTYYVGIKLANSAGTVARLANDVELNEQGYNILGHFSFARLTSEPVVKETLKVMSYNIRALRGGDSNEVNDPMTPAQISDTITKFHSLLSRENPDL